MAPLFNQAPGQDAPVLRRLAEELNKLAVDMTAEAGRRPELFSEDIDGLCDLAERTQALVNLAESGDPLTHLTEWLSYLTECLVDLRGWMTQFDNGSEGNS